jgi:hypothetical protein
VGQFRRDVKRGLKLFKEKNKEWKKSRYGKWYWLLSVTC